MATTTKDLGPVTAYAYAIAGGYQGTEAEFEELVSNLRDSQEMIAETYSTSKTYSVGDYCIYSGVLYVCSTEISTAESWTAAHWTDVKLANRVKTLEEEFSGNYSEEIDINATLIEDKYANYYYGNISDLEGCNVAEFDVSNVIKFNYLYTVDSPDLRGLYFVDSNNTPDDPSYQALTTSQEITVPSWASKCYASVSSLDDIVVTEASSEGSSSTGSLNQRVTNLENSVYGSSSNPLANIRRDPGLLSVFHTVGVIGDSLASGEAVYTNNDSYGYVDLYEFSWGQCLARMTGNTYYNFSEGGISSRSWLSAEAGSGFGPNGIHAFDGDHDCTCYFIGLGQNDKNNSIPIGSTSDINLSDYSQNADTYCGNMGKIIQKIQEQVPKAPIFVFIDPHTPNNDQSYNAVISSIVALFNNVWIIDLKTYAADMFTDSYSAIGSQMRVGHLSAVGYQEVAYLIATYVDWIIRRNFSRFDQVEFIGTNYEYQRATV